MQNWLFILVNVCVAAFVGGITNHFAIKMLFHPREEKIILGRRVPFTPGLIPKRKDRNSRVVGTCGLGLPGDKRGFAGAYSKAGVSG